jgi:hypothetical protein
VDVQSIIDQAVAVDNQGHRIRKLKDILFTEFGIMAVTIRSDK